MLRFCSKACKKAYEHKLEEERRARLRHLAIPRSRGTPELLGRVAGIPLIELTLRSGTQPKAKYPLAKPGALAVHTISAA